jgi:thioredoxin 1
MANGILDLNQSNFSSTISGADKPVIVDFWAPWCGPCRTLSPVLEELAAENADSLVVTKVNVDDNQELAMKYSVRSIPTLLFFKNGELKDQIVGLQPKSELLRKAQAL